MSVSWYNDQSDDELFWFWRLKKGKVPPPKPADVPFEEQYDIGALENTFRELWGRHRCPACGKPFFFILSAWNCHPDASAYKVWNKYQCGKTAFYMSAYDLARTESADTCPFSPYPGGVYGGVGFVEGADKGGFYVGGSPYPGGPNVPAGFIDNSGFVSYDDLPNH